MVDNVGLIFIEFRVFFAGKNSLWREIGGTIYQTKEYIGWSAKYTSCRQVRIQNNYSMQFQTKVSGSKNATEQLRIELLRIN